MPATALIDRTVAPPAFEFSGNAAPVAHGTASERMATALRKHVGLGKAFSVEDFSRKLGVSSSYVEKFMTGERTPGLAMLLTMMRALPPAFANELIELSGLTGARRLNGGAKAPGAVLAEITHHAADLARAWADCKLKHVEKAELRRSLPPLIETLQEFLAQLGQ